MILSPAISEYIHQNQDAFQRDIAALVSQPSVSATNEGVEECALLIRKMLEGVGAETKLLKMDDAPPLVYGQLTHPDSKKTIMFYNHYDVQPVEPLELWKSPPFKPEVRDGRMYGRGVSDDKGHLVARLKLIESYTKVNGKPPCNIKFCFEGEEEVGSGHLEQYVARNPGLFGSDALMWEYGKVDAKGRPIVSLGVKGMMYVEMTVRTLKQDAHSMYAAALPSPVWRLVRLLNLIKDEKGRVRIPGWYDRVKGFTDEEMKILKEEPSEAQDLLSDYGAAGFADGKSVEDAKMALPGAPTANIDGIWGGYTGPGSKTVLPAEVRCKMDFRLVPDQDPDELFPRFMKFLQSNGFSDVSVQKMTMEPGARTSYRSRWAQAALGAAKEVFGVTPVVELSSAGTGPLYVFTKRYSTEALDMGFAPSDDAIHAPNENIRLDYLEKGMLWMGEAIERYLSVG